ncbi:hypothetical protein RRG08_027946 [Elysia crispata]|uniref:Uncharacterized protein n=1 Tax=Elysia crispata TaxID=231223 RepID=A0AAE0ZJH2_9GAST|nr:hypothetical protein RRG08_027946 [Elysia crispata]
MVSSDRPRPTGEQLSVKRSTYSTIIIMVRSDLVEGQLRAMLTRWNSHTSDTKKKITLLIPSAGSHHTGAGSDTVPDRCVRRLEVLITGQTLGSDGQDANSPSNTGPLVSGLASSQLCPGV